MKNKFCPGCGKKTNDLIEGICSECYHKKNEIVNLPKEIKIDACWRCNNLKHKGKWKNIILEKLLEEKILDVLEVEGKIKKVDIILDDPNKKPFTVEVEATITKDDVEFVESDTIIVDINKGICDICSRISSGYYQAILQLRGPQNKINPSMEIANEIIENSSSSMAFISKIEEVKNGVDLYLGSKSTAKKISKVLSERFKTENKSSKTIYGLKDGKKIYRSTYLVKFIDEQ